MLLTLNFHPALYPNPADNTLHITFPKKSTSLIPGMKIYDALGRFVQEVEIAAGSGEKSIDIRALPNGVYFIKWDLPEIPVQPFVVQH